MFSMLRRKVSSKTSNGRRGSSSKPRLETLEERTLLSGFVDGFEGPTLNPFWSQTAQSGYITFPSTAVIHTGSQSVQFNSTNTASNKFITLEHTFAQPVYGRFSVWIYDTGADQGSSNYIAFQIDRLGTHERNSIFGTDYDLGPGQNGSTYSLNPNDQDTIATGVDRTRGWHQFLIDIKPSLATFKIDGTTVYTKPGIPMNHIYLFMGGPNWRPAWTSYFDDFEFNDGTSDIAMQSAQLQTGNAVQFTYETTGNPGPFQVGLYRSVDATFDASDTLIDTQTVTPSPTNPQAPGFFTVPQPLPGDPSQSYLLVVADPGNAISESNENNNAQAILLSDLAPTALNWNADIRGVDLSYAVTGGDLPQDTAAALYWASGPTLADALQPAKVGTIPIQAPRGSASTIHINQTDLTAAPAGTTHVLLVTDPNALIPESNEQNNVRALGAFCRPGAEFPVHLEASINSLPVLPEGVSIALQLDAYDTTFRVHEPSLAEPGALCAATAGTGDLPRFVRVVPYLDGRPLPYSIPVGFGSVEVTVAVFETAPSFAPQDDFQCTFATGAHRCWLNQHVPGHRVLRWLTPGFEITRIGPGRPVHSNTGPLEDWVDLESPTLSLPKNASFQTDVDRAEQLIEERNQDLVFRREIVGIVWNFIHELLVIFDPGQTDLLVTGPNGQQTGVTETGTIVNDIPGSAYVPSVPLMVVAEPEAGVYRTQVRGRVSGDFQLVTALLSSEGILAEESLPGHVAERQTALYSTTLDPAAGLLETVQIVPPTASIAGPTIGVRGQPLRFQVGATDSASDEAAGFVYTVHWGDGTTSTVPRSAGNGSGTTVTHVFAQSGSYSVEVTATDQDDGVSSVATHAVRVSGMAIEPDPEDPTKFALAAGGMSGGDVIFVGIGGRVISMVTPTAAGYEVTVGIFLPGMPNSETVSVYGNVTVRIMTASVSSFSRFMLFGQAGNDILYVGPFNSAPAELDGGAGDDQLTGGRGADILIGGSGADVLTAGAGRDLLIGGDGADRLMGEGGDDILVAGSTAYDSNWVALRAIRNEWTRTDLDYASRVDHLRGVGAGLNGGFAFTKQTVFDDQAVDVLLGGSDRDWFVGKTNSSVGVHDRVVDLVIGERISDIDFDLL